MLEIERIAARREAPPAPRYGNLSVVDGRHKLQCEAIGGGGVSIHFFFFLPLKMSAEKELLQFEPFKR